MPIPLTSQPAGIPPSPPPFPWCGGGGGGVPVSTFSGNRAHAPRTHAVSKPEREINLLSVSSDGTLSLSPCLPVSHFPTVRLSV
ncbi:hypothetical protein BCV69DRAFT_43763 [Microstroma glucosiphilum]|uniref:Uncharacterized protein n=1 Tax=Pseudomicrostroma glucosiphilum TaxID=1684307 RepID=A0A316U486_9BASI|nr:hypothetical protein BCV69DRAFT_43763 [Pseudomicrostroma glucosiphilum]PWN19584.1 hypothetical protein BCV69DRAFT_43763 [Pseudomicrostroma glucosiphilum]